MPDLYKAARSFISTGAELVLVTDCQLSPDRLLSFTSRGRRSRFPAVGLAVTEWQAKGGGGEWGIRLVGWGGWREVNGIFSVDGLAWKELKLVEAVARDGCVRRAEGRGEGGEWVEGVDLVSMSIKAKMGWEEGPGMLGNLHDLACKVDAAVWELSCRTTRVVCFGPTRQEEYMRGGHGTDCEVVLSAQHIDLVGAWAVCSKLLQSSKQIMLVLDPNDGPLPAQLGAPFLDYERLGCGWSPNSKSIAPTACPVPLAAIACGYLAAEHGVLQAPIARLSDLPPPPQGGRIFFTTLSPPYLKESEQIKKLVAWAPGSTVVGAPPEGGHNTTCLATIDPCDVCCVFLGLRHPGDRFALYRLRATFSHIVVLHTTAGSTQMKGSYWDGTFY
jgi:hypothetical protein